MILAGDVGGTKVYLALARARGGGIELLEQQRVETADHDALESVIREFLAGRDLGLEAAAFGLAGPIVGDRCRLPNLDWTIERHSLAAAAGVDRVELLNDLEATGHGVALLSGDQVAVLDPGRPRGRKAALIAAGTGLGMTIMSEREAGRDVAASEGGHADFAPRDDLELELLRFLRARHGRVSVERVVSGPGIRAIYEFLKETGREPEPGWLAERLEASEDPSETISAAALAGEAAICEAAMRTFVGCYGAAAGNLVLTALALRGLWVGGGIAPAILPLLRDGTFVAAVRAKGRMAELLAELPVAVVTEERTALMGAAWVGVQGGRGRG